MEWLKEHEAEAARLYGAIIGGGGTPKEALRAVMRLGIEKAASRSTVHPITEHHSGYEEVRQYLNRQQRFAGDTNEEGAAIMARENLDLLRQDALGVAALVAVLEADSAALLKAGKDMLDVLTMGPVVFTEADYRSRITALGQAAVAPRPGTALLEQMQHKERALETIQQVGGVRGGAWCAGQALRALAGQPLMPLDGTLPAPTEKPVDAGPVTP